MANDELARAYAQAIFEQATERWKKQLGKVHQALTAQPELLPRLDSATEPFERKKDQANRLLPAGIDPEVRNFVYLLVSKGDMHRLGEVLAEFERMAERGPTLELARVTSAVDLTPDDKKQLEAKLSKQFGADLQIEYRVDPSILGGLVVRVGDRVIDGSVASKLAAMKQRLETTR